MRGPSGEALHAELKALGLGLPLRRCLMGFA